METDPAAAGASSPPPSSAPTPSPSQQPQGVDKRTPRRRRHPRPQRHRFMSPEDMAASGEEEKEVVEEVDGALGSFMKELELGKFITHSVRFLEINTAVDLMLKGESLRCIMRME